MRRAGPSIARKVYLPPEVDAQVNILLADPLRNKTKYGSFSQLMTMLVTDYLATLEPETNLITRDNEALFGRKDAE